MDKESSVATFNPITKETLQYPYVQSIGYAFSSFIFTPCPSFSSDSLAVVEGLPFFLGFYCWSRYFDCERTKNPLNLARLMPTVTGRP